VTTSSPRQAKNTTERKQDCPHRCRHYHSLFEFCSNRSSLSSGGHYSVGFLKHALSTAHDSYGHEQAAAPAGDHHLPLQQSPMRDVRSLMGDNHSEGALQLDSLHP
jgi:hypothetical protein